LQTVAAFGRIGSSIGFSLSLNPAYGPIIHKLREQIGDIR
jgi:hypothetical protein